MSTLFSGNRLTVPKTPTEKKEVILASRITPLLTAEQLLKNPKHQKTIAQCEQLMELSPEQRDTYTTPLLNAFVEMVQSLPETRNSYYARPGGFIAHALLRTCTALSMCRAYFSTQASDQASGNSKKNLSAEESLWMYALFSAGIFNGIGKVFSDLIVELYDDDGKHIDRWNPFKGHMLKTKARTYDYDFEEAQHIDLFSRRLSVLLAKQLMPAEGFAWLSSDKEVLSFWLALLEDNQRDSGTLGPIMIRADAMAINSYFDEKRMQQQYSDLDIEAKAETDDITEEKEEEEEKNEEEEIQDKDEENKEKAEAKTEEKKDIKLRFSASFTPPPENEKPQPGSEADKAEKRNPNSQAGVEFLKWLNNQLKAQRFELNDTLFYMPAGAIFLPTALFEEFRRKNPYYRSAADIMESFNKLQLNMKSSEKNGLHTFIRTLSNDEKKIEGIVLNNAQLILPKSINIRLNNGDKKSVNSSELSHYTHLFEPLQPLGKAASIAPPPEQKQHYSAMFGTR